MFKRRQQPPLPENPWMAAKREWIERNGAELASLRWWRGLALFSMLTAAVAVGAALWFAAQPIIKPFVVAVDDLGRAQAIGVMDDAATADERVIRAQLGKLIESWRLVSPDGTRQRRAIETVYSMLPTNTPARRQLNEWYSINNPLERAQDQLVSVALSSVLKVTDTTYQVEWYETVRKHDGKKMSDDRYKAALQIHLQPPTSEKQVYLNPLGILLNDISWAKQQIANPPRRSPS